MVSELSKLIKIKIHNLIHIWSHKIKVITAHIM